MKEISAFVNKFVADQTLQERIVAVFAALPHEVRNDLLDDERFTMAVHHVDREEGLFFRMAAPGIGDDGSRMIVWKSSLANNSLAFANYVIAHELAHAYLRNRGRTPDEDPEDAADALAAEWGYHKPESAKRFTWWRRT